MAVPEKKFLVVECCKTVSICAAHRKAVKMRRELAEILFYLKELSAKEIPQPLRPYRISIAKLLQGINA